MQPTAAAAARARYTDSGTHNHPSTTARQVVTTVLAAQFGGFGRVLIELNCSALTRSSNVFSVEASDNDGATWAPVAGSAMTASAAQHFRYEFTTSNSFRVLLGSGALEGASRSIPWKINVY